MASLNSTPVVDVIKKYQEILKPSVKGKFGRRRFMLGKHGIATYYSIDKLVDNVTSSIFVNLHLSISVMVSPAVQGQVPHPLIVPEFLRTTSCGMTSARGQGAIVYCLNSGVKVP
ncbi:hypothetical protein TNCV_1713621 [Trichonephila clavipes]|nr:hypothetical protein TNCV_1713621 [Trichonephila clavipes]